MPKEPLKTFQQQPAVSRALSRKDLFTYKNETFPHSLQTAPGARRSLDGGLPLAVPSLCRGLIASPEGGSGAHPASIPESYFSKINLKKAFKGTVNTFIPRMQMNPEGPGRGKQARVSGTLFFKGLSGLS